MEQNVLILSSLLAGLGLFFFGMSLLTDNLKKLSGKKLREKIAKWTDKKLQGLLWGGVLIAITQSTAAATFILIGMMKSGMMSVKKAMPMIIGFNMFAGLIVFILVIDIKAFVFVILGLAALLFTSDNAYKVKNISGAVLGMAILFLGLITMQNGVAPLADELWFKESIEFAQGSYFLAFTIGALLTLLVQSSLAVIVFSVAFERAGLLSMYEVMMIVYGSNVGSSILTYFLSSKLTGNAKQVAMFQVAYNNVGALLMLPLFYLEVYTDIPLVKALVEAITTNTGTQIAIVFLLFNALPGFVLYFLITPISTMFQKFWPETKEEAISKPQYIHNQMIEDPTSSIDLIHLEQNRLLEIISSSFNTLREGANEIQRKLFHEAFDTLSGIINESIKELTSKANLSPDEYSKINLILNNQYLLESLNISLEKLGMELWSIKKLQSGKQFSNVVVEGLDTILLTLIDVAREKDEFDMELIAIMTSSDGKGIAKIRSAYLDEEDGVNTESKMLLLSATNLTERLIHDFGSIAKNYEKIETIK